MQTKVWKYIVLICRPFDMAEQQDSWLLSSGSLSCHNFVNHSNIVTFVPL